MWEAHDWHALQLLWELQACCWVADDSFHDAARTAFAVLIKCNVDQHQARADWSISVWQVSAALAVLTLLLLLLPLLLLLLPLLLPCRKGAKAQNQQLQIP